MEKRQKIVLPFCLKFSSQNNLKIRIYLIQISCLISNRVKMRENQRRVDVKKM